MKEQVLLYSVCAAISVAAVGITSIAKIVVCAIAKRAGKDLSGNVKEYIFTPIALILAALGLYIWLEKFMHVEDEELFVLIIVCFSVGTMLIYWLLFQPTRKLATALIHAIARRVNAEPVVDAASAKRTGKQICRKMQTAAGRRKSRLPEPEVKRPTIFLHL